MTQRSEEGSSTISRVKSYFVVSAQTNLKKGKNLFKENKYDEAIQAYSNALRSKSTYILPAEIYRHRGQAYYQTKNYELAFADLTRAALSNQGQDLNESALILVLGYLILCLTKLQRYDEAIERLDLIIKVDPKNVEAFHNRAGNHMLLKQYQQAINDFEQAILLEFDEMDTFFLCAICYAALEQHEKAIAYYKKALQYECESKVKKNIEQRLNISLHALQEAVKQNDQENSLIINSVIRSI